VAGFDFQALQSQMDEHNALAEQRRQMEEAAAQRQRQIAEKSARLTSQYGQSLTFLRDTLEQNNAAVTRERKLQSGNIFDQITLEGLKMIDPNRFDAQRRSQRLSEDMQRAGAVGQLHNANQSVLQAEAMEGASQVEEMKTIEGLSLQRLKSFRESAEIMRGNFEAAETMTILATNGMDTSQLDAAIAQAQLSGGKTNIGGVDISLDRLKGLRTDRSEVEFTREYRGLIQERQLFEAQELVKNIPGEQAINDVKRRPENVQAEQLLAQESVNDRLRIMDQRAQERMLGHVPLERINEIRANNYIDPEDGMKYDPAIVDTAHSRQLAARSDTIANRVNEETFKQYDTKALMGEADRVDALMPRFPANSPLAQTAYKYKQTLATVSNVVGPDRPATDRMVGMTMLDAARSAFDKAIDAQVKVDTKDANMQEVYREFYRGNPIPTENLFSALDERLRSNKSLSGVLPADLAIRVQKYYAQGYQQKKVASMGSIGGGTDDKLLRAEAAQEALDRTIGEMSATQSNGAILDQINFPGHPLRSMGKERFMSVIATADQKAFTVWAEGNKLTPENAFKISQGETVEGLDPAEAQSLFSQLQQSQNTQLLLQLEAHRPGAGTELTEWWAQSGMDYISNINPTVRGGATVSDGVVNSLVKDRLQEQLKNYGLNLYQADGNIRQEQAKDFAGMINFGGNPEASQIIMLNMAKELGPDEKRRVFDGVIKPLLVEAEQRGLGFKDANAFVENGILNPSPNVDPGVVSLLKTLKRTRGDVVDHVDQLARWGAYYYAYSWEGYDEKTQNPTPDYLDWYKGGQKFKKGPGYPTSDDNTRPKYKLPRLGITP
jgi:hypothetical protein